MILINSNQINENFQQLRCKNSVLFSRNTEEFYVVQMMQELNVSTNQNEHQEINSTADFAFLKGCLIPKGTSINTDIKNPHIDSFICGAWRFI